MSVSVLQRTPVYTDGTYLIMLIGHPNYQGYPVCKGKIERIEKFFTVQSN